MRWLVHEELWRQDAIRAVIAWAAGVLDEFKTGRLLSVRLAPLLCRHACVGWCHWRGDGRPRAFRILVRVPADYPWQISLIHEPARLVDGKFRTASSACVSPVLELGRAYRARGGELRRRASSRMWLYDSAAAFAFIFGHELHHYLCTSRQLREPDTEAAADDFGAALLSRWYARLRAKA